MPVFRRRAIRCDLPQGFRLPILIICFLAWSPITWGVVIATGDGSANTTAPLDDPGFANVGTRGVGSAVFLGNRWVLTAAHLGAGTVTFGDQTYSPLSNETVRLGNPEGLTPETDLLLLRLPDDPRLPRLRLPCNERQLGASFTMIGNGHDREPLPTYWSVKVSPGLNDDTWTEVTSEAESDRQGFRTLDTQSIRWGIGSTGLTNLTTESDNGDVLSFTSSFTRNLAIDDLAQAVRGDSGGAAFQKNLGVWELIGLVFAIDPLENQPGGTRSAIYGGSTFVADLFRYADAIREAAEFEPSPGDLNGDGLISASEIDFMLAVQNRGEFASCHSDIDGNGNVSPADVGALLELAQTLVGDADLDGKVAFSDFLIISRSFGSERTGWANGDYDGDGRVSFADFLDLSRNFGISARNTDNRQATTVPEPSLPTGLWGVAFIGWLRRATRPRTKLESETDLDICA